MAQEPAQVGALRITFPLNRTVLQRDGNNQANVNIAGQLIGSDLYNRVLQYKLVKIDTKTGNDIQEMTNGYETINDINNDIGNINLKTFLKSRTTDASWYRLQVRIRRHFPTYKTVARTDIIFGVGDVYLIAGQSNAQGYKQEGDNPNNGDDSGIVQNSNNYTNYHAISSIDRAALNDVGNTIAIKGLPINSEIIGVNDEITLKQLGFTKLENKKSNGDMSNIYPRGKGSWCWGPMASKLIENNSNIPILLFNAAERNTDISGWSDKYWRDDNGNYTNPPSWANDPCIATPSAPCPNNATYMVYKQFRSSLQMYGHILGLKSILWHQGEKDGQRNLGSYNYYTSKMNDLIAQSRTDIGNPSLSWLSSEVSYYYNNGEQNKSVGGSRSILNLAQQTVWNVNAQKYTGIFTDDLGADARNSVLKIHFTGETHKTVGDRWADKNPLQTNPTTGKSLLPLTITQNGSSYRLTAPSGYSKYFWVENENGIYSPLNPDLNQNYYDIQPQNGTTKFITCYAGQSTGEDIGNATDGWNLKISMTQPFIIPGYENATTSLVSSKNTLGYGKTGGSNSFIVSATNLSWQAIENVSWLSFQADEDLNGGEGNYPITVITDPNTNLNDRVAYITVQQEGGGLSQTIQIYQEGLNSCASSLNLTSPNDDYNFSTTKKSQSTITASNKITGNSIQVQYKAANAIVLTPGFRVDNGTIFKAQIEGCVVEIPWQNNVIGNAQGVVSMNNGVLSISSTGSVSGASDNIQYYNKSFSGDVTILARITSLTAIDGMRAGIMLRSSLDANSKMYEFILDGNGNVGKLKRRNTNDDVSFVGYTAAPTNNTWLKVIKTGNTIQCYVSTDGNTYNEVVGWDTLNDNDLGTNFFVGIVNYNSGNNQYSDVVFDNISVNATPVY